MDRALNYANIRPYAVPHSLEELAGPADGIVTLPGWLDWSPRRSYNLSDPAALRVMYEQVIQEGREQDLTAYLNADLLARVWPALILPVRVRRLWESRFIGLRDRAA
ncbi:hypothetical protein ACFFMN_38300 [Planobispora siamensis]|uniref:Uncharacterized protein n=1 Tax=Planobispora siamensis TaxID=936338 RepID=A0A8J3SS59_9ACTN|nr:hypothetical protein [Planobispora siamensis]GIH97872.1 hypothetical protein Psi01_85020 [Planobispora siamensis]